MKNRHSAPTLDLSSEQPEIALLRRVQSGDRAAFTALYQEFHPRLYSYLFRLLKDRFLIEEVLDDVMFVVWKDALKFRQDSKLSTWIFGIAYRQALSAIRQQRRYREPLDTGSEMLAAPAVATDVNDWVAAGLEQLSSDHRQVIVLTYIGGFSCQEIAEIAGCPLNTVKTRMFHARRRLKILLPPLAGNDEETDRERG